jgi:DNA-binding response OmpR family regulator
MVALVSAALEILGIQVLPAYSVDEARRLLDPLPDLALIDVNLGATSGFELLEELRRRSSMPIIMLTGRTAEKDAERGLSLGADDYVRKPFSVRELVARVERRLRRG